MVNSCFSKGLKKELLMDHVHANLIVLVNLLADVEFIGECNHFFKSKKSNINFAKMKLRCLY